MEVKVDTRNIPFPCSLKLGGSLRVLSGALGEAHNTNLISLLQHQGVK